MELNKDQTREVIAKRVALELKDDDAVNLDIGLPTMAPNCLKPGVHVILQPENGMISMGSAPAVGQEGPLWISAGGDTITVMPEAATFDSVISFGVIHGDHVDISILDAPQADEVGDLTNRIIPGKLAPGMGGAMDLLVGTRKVILTMIHTAKGETKILKECILSLTAASQVDLIITELCAIEMRKGQGLYVAEIHDGVTREEIEVAIEAALYYVGDVRPIRQ